VLVDVSLGAGADDSDGVLEALGTEIGVVVLGRPGFDALGRKNQIRETVTTSTPTTAPTAVRTSLRFRGGRYAPRGRRLGLTASTPFR
jgi:hypothetical protein